MGKKPEQGNNLGESASLDVSSDVLLAILC